MAKAKKSFSCNSCGTQYPRWSGRCESCGQWNTIVELIDTIGTSSNSGRALEPIKLAEFKDTKKDASARFGAGNKHLDEFLGGGIVEGSVCLLAGEPGIGKSTLLMQLCADVAKKKTVLYISAEESVQQVSLRAQRIGASGESLSLVSTTSVDDIIATMQAQTFDLVVVDSIQTVRLNDVSSAPGSPSQINSSAQSLISAAKASDTAMVIVGHVTKQGSIAGPKLLEHIVDVVLAIEGDKFQDLRVLRSNKNRYGSTNESVIYRMSDSGMSVVDNPSSHLLSERANVDGSVVFAAMDGNRPLLVEVQALVNPTQFGYPKRTASGFDLNRLNLLIAVLQKRTKLTLDNYDVYVNIVGGFKVDDPGADMAVAMAIASATKGLALEDTVAVFGEIGLGGETRRVRGADKRISEARKQGYTTIIGPSLSSGTKPKGYKSSSDIRSALNTFLQ